MFTAHFFGQEGWRQKHFLYACDAFPTMPRDVVVLWTERDWRCELHTGGIPGEGRLLVYHGETVVTAESVPMGTAAHIRAEILRHRVLRGNLR
jgi:hypothetical protein